MDTKRCVRCGEVPPDSDPWHRGVGALSRTDNRTYICSRCGTSEALQDFSGEGLTPQNQWPIRRK